MKNILKSNKIWMIAILLLAFVLRFYKLADFPALNADEAALGYNAWSLIETGLDEHGNSWPIHLQSFNDYKPALYAYLIIPFVKLGGLNEWVVRFPGALLGVATVWILYLLAGQLIKPFAVKSDKKTIGMLGERTFPLLASLFLAISPWHIHFSRGGWEVNVAAFFITTGILFFLKWVNSCISKTGQKADKSEKPKSNTEPKDTFICL